MKQHPNNTNQLVMDAMVSIGGRASLAPFVANRIKHDSIATDEVVRLIELSKRYYEHDKHDGYIMGILTAIKHWSFTKANHRVVYFYEWSRDCDLMEADSVRLIPATLEAYLEAENLMYECAEGPCHCCLISPEEGKNFKPYWRDIAAEMMNY